MRCITSVWKNSKIAATTSSLRATIGQLSFRRRTSPTRCVLRSSAKGLRSRGCFQLTPNREKKAKEKRREENAAQKILKQCERDLTEAGPSGVERSKKKLPIIVKLPAVPKKKTKTLPPATPTLDDDSAAHAQCSKSAVHQPRVRC